MLVQAAAKWGINYGAQNDRHKTLLDNKRAFELITHLPLTTFGSDCMTYEYDGTVWSCLSIPFETGSQKNEKKILI